MKYNAVIFDLFGTLVKNLSIQEWREGLIEIATVFSVNPDSFIKLWFDRSDERMNGIVKNFQEDIEYICKELDTSVEDEKLRMATRIRFDMTRNLKMPREEVLKVLSELKVRGYKTGLISDCSFETTLMWRSTPFPPLFDVVVFSCLVGVSKPDPRIYEYALGQLKLKPPDCLYVGDGGSRELKGANQVGMDAVLLQIPEENSPDIYRYNREEWNGPTISSLKEVLELIA